jgi:hypothetical protein
MEYLAAVATMMVFWSVIRMVDRREEKRRRENLEMRQYLYRCCDGR